MIERSDFTIAGLATCLGVCIQQAMAAYLALPVSVQTLLQGMLTIALGLTAVGAQHFFRRWLKRNFPEDEAAQIEQVVKRIDWASVTRRVIAAARDLIRSRKKG